MSWLPAIVEAGSRWWFPLSRPTADVLATLIVSQDREPLERTSLMLQAMRCDPALTLFAMLWYRGQLFGNAASGVSLNELAARAAGDVRDWFSSPDRSLGVPRDRDCLIPQWMELRHSLLRMPLQAWSSALESWLTITGPALPPTLSASAIRLVDDDTALILSENDPSFYAPVQLDLYELVRRLDVANQWQQGLDERVDRVKRAALKQFAYGISHEINNPLANISARAQSLMSQGASDSQKASLQRIVDQAMRAHDMVADLMFYAHPPAIRRKEFNVVELFSSLLPTYANFAKERNIRVHVAAAVPSELSISGDQALIRQAVAALIQNAIEAIGCDGVVELDAYHERAGERNGTLDPPARIVIEVRDSGPGLSEEARCHAFDPYFSGREAGRGLGVGLCRVLRTAQLHGGDASLSSGLAGCVARLWIPA